MEGIVPPTPPLSTSEPSITGGGRLPAQGEAAAYMHPRPWQWWRLKILYSWCSAPVSMFCLWFIRLSDQTLHLGELFQPVIICHNMTHLTFARIETGLLLFRAGPNGYGYPIPARYLTFFRYRTWFSLENHRIGYTTNWIWTSFALSRAQQVPNTCPLPDIFLIPDPTRFNF